MIFLVHGAWHDSTCWDDVERELAAMGRPASSVDVPGADPRAATAEAVGAVLDAVALRPADEKVVLVGHSLGGLAVVPAAERLGPERVRVVVLVAALVPCPGMSYNDQLRADPHLMSPGFGVGQERNEDRTTWWPPQAARDGLYRGVADEVPAAAVERAIGRLRPQSWGIAREPSELREWPPIRTVSVVCADDRVIDPGWSRRAAADIGAEVVELPGGHFPMLTRPRALAEVLAGVAGG